jgi:predicted dehydrogenase
LLDDIVVCDSIPSRAQEVAQDAECSWVEDITAILDDGNIAAAIVATPTASHAPLTIALLEAGIDVLVEKPMASDVESAVVMMEAADANARLLVCGHPLRYHAGLMAVAEMLDAGELGPIIHIEADRLSVREPREDSGVISALAIHDIDICKMLLNEAMPCEVRCIALASDIEGIEDHATIHLTFPTENSGTTHGVAATLTSSWRSRIRGKTRSLRIYGRDASIHIDTLQYDGFHLHSHPGQAIGDIWGGASTAPSRWVKIDGGEQSLTAELRAFIRASRFRQADEIRSPPEIGLDAIRIVEAAKQSAACGAAVTINALSSIQEQPAVRIVHGTEHR